MRNQREANYDLLRIICAIAVIVIHVSGIYTDSINNSDFFGALYEKHTLILMLWGALPSFAVPCFIMLSGAFLLDDDRNEDYSYFYKKSIKSIVIPTIIFSLLYFLYSEILICAGIIVKGKEVSRILIPIMDFIKGKPYYHMWYLYTLLGIYLFVPVILKVKKSVKEDTFHKICIAMFLICGISGRTSSFSLNWSITKVSCYLGYFMMGYLLRKCNINRKSNRTGILFIFLGVFSELVLMFMDYMNKTGVIKVGDIVIDGGHFNPLVLVATLLIFTGFSKSNINLNLHKLSSKTFYIYLIHAFVWNLLSRVVRKIGVEGDARIIIPFMVVCVFVLSYVLSVIYVKLWEEIDRKYLVTEKTCKALSLK